ncbi:lipid IV(A) 3-deoxy-D-manno-octulosonic acid transferase [Candidatus Halobeggiatoa sp. HSG11]|nr:lipid IV(A) 3-deoxy-D-manno-octulosonic acid transferase [Candidatus Halobeggiatoa sp. HSG11]
MRFIYTLTFYLIVPFLLVYLFWRGFKAPAYWQRWPERFGLFSALPVDKCLWVHAVSMGEVQAAIPLIQALQDKFPNQSILVTTTTPTGSQRVKEQFGNKVWHVYLPYDLPGPIARFLTRTKPCILILMETELWPNLLHACQHIPIVVANARLSVNSAKGYQRIGKLTQQMLNKVTVIAAQTKVDAYRFIQLGIDSSKVQTTGSIKFDNNLSIPDQNWNINRKVWIAASTHAGEEEIILEVFTKLKQNFKKLLLVLVPRHPERFNQVAKLCEQRGFITTRRTQGDVTTDTEIYLGDTMGELATLYTIADVAFVGGSLVPIGCHNLLEPAAVGIPVIMGPHVFECSEICRQLLEAQAAKQVTDVKQLHKTVNMYLNNIHLAKKTGNNGRLFVQENQGALQRLLNIIFPLITNK